jgi:hypothetical protein
LHQRLVPGFALDARLDGADRIVTFFNGAVLRERLVDLDDEARRLVWSIVDGPYTQHNASTQVVADGQGGTRFVWIADLLPNELAGPPASSWNAEPAWSRTPWSPPRRRRNARTQSDSPTSGPETVGAWRGPLRASGSADS